MKKFSKICAEAIVKETFFEGQKAISKKRIKKNYRNNSLDFSIRKRRTKSEAKILNELYTTINVPRVFFVDEKECEIIMSFVEGDLLKNIIETKKDLCIRVGREIRKIHDAGIVHGDLTTSNIIFSDGKLFFIDFGLGYFSKKIEDKATDLVVFKKTLNSTHSGLKNSWGLVMKGYEPDNTMLNRLEKIEKRARYH